MMHILSTNEEREAKKLVIHLISDSTGQTVKYAAISAMKFFPDTDVQYYNWPLIINDLQMQQVLSKIKRNPGIILYTFSEDGLIEILEKFCEELQLPCISVVEKIIEQISLFLKIGAKRNKTDSSFKFDKNYFEKLDAIHYTIRHDDGQLTEELGLADIILIGPSRTSKTPTSVYLAFNGFKVANIPYIYDLPFSSKINNLSSPLIVGLVIDADILVEFRETRMIFLKVMGKTSYTDKEIVEEECLAIKKICSHNGWPIIDVSKRSIEETAALIMKFYYEKKTNKNKFKE